MLDGTLFDKLEYIARYVRGNDEPFGGIQLIVSGDFFQLPPVPDQNNGIPVPATYAFDAETWQLCVGAPVVLSRVFRQKDNGKYLCFHPEDSAYACWNRICENVVSNETRSIGFTNHRKIQPALSATHLRRRYRGQFTVRICL
jgi:hypothetical protein